MYVYVYVCIYQKNGSQAASGGDVLMLSGDTICSLAVFLSSHNKPTASPDIYF